MVPNNLVKRKNFYEVHPRVGYHLTKTGIKALIIVDEIELFGRDSLLKVDL